MDTTNRKAGSATLAACALFLPCVASAGCRGVGTDGAAGRTEASGPASTIRGESAPATRSATDLPGGGEGSRRAGTRRGRERRTGSRANRRFPAKCQAPRRGPSSEPRSGRGHPAAKARTRPSPRSRARGRSVRPSASPRKRLDAPRKCEEVLAADPEVRNRFTTNRRHGHFDPAHAARRPGHLRPGGPRRRPGDRVEPGRVGVDGQPQPTARRAAGPCRAAAAAPSAAA